MIRQTGWTLEYVNALSIGDWKDFWQVIDGEGNASDTIARDARARKR